MYVPAHLDDAVLDEVRALFTLDAFPTIQAGYREACTDAAIERVFESASCRDQADQIPSGVDGFLSTTACIFSDCFLTHLRGKFTGFDITCGDSLSDAFLTEKSVLDWTCLLVEHAIQHHSREVMDRWACPQWDWEYASVSHPCCPSSQPPVPIEQIKLSGSCLKTAWWTSRCSSGGGGGGGGAVDDMPAMGMGMGSLAEPQAWSPSVAGGAPVYRGMAIQHEYLQHARTIEHYLSTNPSTFRRVPGKTTFFPDDGHLSGIYTSFSALRSFLWAAFKAEILYHCLDKTAGRALTDSFQMRGQTFHGVLLLKFHPDQPAPPGLTSFTIAEGKELDWRHTVFSWRPSRQQLRPTKASTSPPRAIWEHDLKHIHQQDTRDYPDIIHGRDMPVLRDAFLDWPCKQSLLWQTAFMSPAAANQLNSRLVAIYAISFERPQVGHEQEAQPKEQEKVYSTLVPRLGERLKRIISKMGFRDESRNG